MGDGQYGNAGVPRPAADGAQDSETGGTPCDRQDPTRSQLPPRRTHRVTPRPVLAYRTAPNNHQMAVPGRDDAIE